MRLQGNKNECLARCRLLWTTMIKYRCDKIEALLIIYGREDIFESECPLCEHQRQGKDLKCSGCIQWVKHVTFMYHCQSTGSAYKQYEMYGDCRSMQLVLSTIDMAIALYDKTGNWR